MKDYSLFGPARYKVYPLFDINHFSSPLTIYFFLVQQAFWKSFLTFNVSIFQFIWYSFFSLVNFSHDYQMFRNWESSTLISTASWFYVLILVYRSTMYILLNKCLKWHYNRWWLKIGQYCHLEMTFNIIESHKMSLHWFIIL